MNNNQKPQIIQSIKKHFEIFQLHSKYVLCILILDKNRIVTGSLCSISISNINYNSQTWHTQIHIPNAHNDWILYLSNLNHNRLISCSSDNTFKIWEHSINDKLILITSINIHTQKVLKVISLTNNIIVSISYDRTIKFWEDITFKQQNIPFEKQENIPSCIIQLKHKENELCISTSNVDDNYSNANNYNSNILFYNINFPYNLKGKINGVNTNSKNGMIELQNGNIALSNSTNYPNKIIIINPFQYTIITEIIDTTYINGTGSLRVFDNESFIYTCLGRICQIAFINHKYQLVYKKKAKFQELFGSNGVIMTHNDKYIITSTLNGNNGINIYKWE